MIDFGLMLDEPAVQAPAKPVEVVQEAPAQVVQEVTTTKVGTAEASYLLKPSAQWTWQDLRDYVITEAEGYWGPQIRNPAKESGIFKGFIARHGIENAVLVAMAAFEIYNGVWRKAPITATRFTKGNDEYFADVILTRVKG